MANQSASGLRKYLTGQAKQSQVENINPRQPTRLPLLFALDTKLNIANGFRYTPNCDALRRDSTGSSGTVHCGGDFSDSSYDGSTDGFGDSPSGDGSSGEDGGGDGGSGCGGGD